MMYKFKSRAAADLLMTEPVGNRVLSLMGKDHTPQGIIDVDQLGPAIAALEAAVAAECPNPPCHVDEDDERPHASSSDHVSLRQRVWPMVQMLKAAQAEEQPVVWGV
jgi:cyclopropane-fatty-acyl-phospholipid synthase